LDANEVFNYQKYLMKIKATIVLIMALGLVSTGIVFSAAEEQGDKSVTVKGEVVDMACYTDHGASGEKHAECAKKCITSGLPVGLKADDGKTYLVIGDHKPMNTELAQYAGKTITVKGKAVSRDGVNMIKNAEIVK
jgi:type 1 fimbria pilin